MPRNYATPLSLNQLQAQQHADTVEFFRIGYSGQADSLHFRVSVRQWPTFAEILELPALRKLQLARLFRPLWDEVSRVELGREGSLVMYVEIPFTQQQRNGGDNARSIRIPMVERIDLTQRVLDAGAEAGADERTVLQHQSLGVYLAETMGHPGPCPHRVRLWWD